MGYYAKYKAVFEDVKSKLQTVKTLKQVVLGEQYRLTNLPLAIINPTATTIKQASLGSTLENTVGFDVLIIIRETQPSEWFTDIISPMADVVDALLADRTLGGLVKDVAPTAFEPGEIKMMQKLYYGGLIRFQILLYFSPLQV